MKALSIFILALLVLTACKDITKEEAIKITQEFVDSQVKFYVNENNESPIIQKARITILDTLKKDNKWFINLNIMSNQTGDTKQNNLLVIVDAKNGNILNMEKV